MNKSLPYLMKILPFIFMTMFVVGCGKKSDNPTDNNGGGDNPPPNLVIINNFAFTPSTITIAVGETVTWRNDQNVAHTVTSDSGNTLNSPTLGQGQTYSKTFTAAGTYPYHCTIHPSMTGRVIVQ